jgi:16S rRNA processing protein RimM
MTDQDLRIIGVITEPHGLQGTVKVFPLSDFPERFFRLKSCYLRRKDGSIIEAIATSAKLAGRYVFLTLDISRTRDEADAIRGCEICVAEKDSWPLPDGTYYISDIIGFKAISEDCRDLGRLTGILRGAQDILQIEGPKGEILVPFVKEWVGPVNVKDKSIQILNWRMLADAASTDDHPDPDES